MNRDLRAIQLMETAVDLPSEQQAVFIQEACQGDSELLRKVQAMLDAADDESGFLATRDGEPTVAASSAPQRIGNYRILGEIGRGGMGVVYDAEHDAMQRRVALKVLSAGNSPTKNQLARFYREARAAGQLHHTNIVPVFEVGSAEDLHYYTMQFIEGANLDLIIEELRGLRGDTDRPSSDRQGRSLARRLLDGSGSKSSATHPSESAPHQPSPAAPTVVIKKNFDSSESVFSATDSSTVGNARDAYYRRVAAVALQAAEALEYAHQHGTLHRDIKPTNLMIDTQGIVWVLDFGLAKGAEETLTQTGDIVGTLRYMSPERFDGETDARSDIYGLGLTLYELCTLRLAFDGTDRATLLRQVTTQTPQAPRQIDRNIPLDLETIILKSIEREPGRRYKSAHQMAEDLHLYIQDLPIKARRISATERIWRVCRRNPTLSAMASCIALLLIALSIGALRWGVESQNLARASKSAEQKATENSQKVVARNYQLNVSRAESVRRSGLPGQRSDALMAIEHASDLLPYLGLTPERVQQELVNLRSNLIAAMAVVDVEPQRTWRYDTQPSAIAFSRDYAWLARSDAAGNIHVESTDKKRVPRLKIATSFGKVNALLFNRTADYLVSRHARQGEQAATICVWNLVKPSHRPFIQVSATASRGCGDFLDSAYVVEQADGIAFYSLDSGEKMEKQIAVVGANAVQADGNIVAFSLVGEDIIEIWDVAEQPQRLHQQKLDSQLYSYRYHAQRNVLVAGMIDGSILVWRNGLDRRYQQHNVHQQVVLAARIHPREPLIVTEGYDATVRVFNFITGTIELQIAGYKIAGNASFSEDGKQLGFTGLEEFGIWKFPESPLRTIQHDITGADPSNFEVHFFPGNKNILVSSNTARIEFWNANTGQRLAHRDDLASTFIAFTPDGESLLASGREGLRRLSVEISSADGSPGGYSVRLGEPELLLDEQAMFLRIRDDGKFAITSLRQTSNAAILALDQPSGSIVRTGTHPSITSVALSSDGKWAATGTWRGNELRIWDATNGQLVTTLLPKSRSTMAAFTPDSKFLLGIDKEAIHLWRTGSWTPVESAATRDTHRRVGYVEFSKNGRLLLTNKTDYVPQLISVDSMRTLAKFETPHLQRPGDFSFCDDNSRLAIRGYLASYIWDLEPIRTELQKLGLDWDD